MSRSVTALARYRRHRPLGTALFILLLFVVSTERRLADAHFNLRSAAPGLESDDILDGDEIRVRLIVLNDDKPPRLPHVSSAIAREPVPAIAQCCDSVALGRPAPRGPPASSSSAA
jgi:hypothetical protein